MKSIAFIINNEKPLAAEALCRLRAEAKNAGLEVVDEAPEIYVVLGGDGTMLRAAHKLADSSVPLLGLNYGTLGYLTCTDETGIAEAFGAIASSSLVISERKMLQSSLSEKPALNDIVLTRSSGRAAHITLRIDGYLVNTYSCDGIIVSTPTGSTAYSLSAGGPVLLPESSVTVITVICPHTLGTRPIVVPSEAKITLLPENDYGSPLLFSIDGEETAHVAAGKTVAISRSLRTTRIAFLPDHNPFAALNNKLARR